MFQIGKFDIKNFLKILEKIKNTYPSLNEMARKSEITSSYLSKLLAQKYEEPPSPKILRKIADNSNGIISYMDLLKICGYIDMHTLFDYCNDIFIKMEHSNINNNLEDIKEKFFDIINENNDSDIKNIENKKVKVVENANKVPVLKYLTSDIIIIKNKKLKANYNEKIINDYTYFSSKYFKKEYNYVGKIVEDNSMNLKFNKEDILLIQLQETLKQGDIGYISVNDKYFVRKYISEDRYVVLETLSNNENYTTEFFNTDYDKVKILGKVVAYQGKI